MYTKEFYDKSTDDSHGFTSTLVFYNGDYSGNVCLKRQSEKETYKIWIPFWQLKELVAGYVRDQRIRMLEEADADVILLQEISK